MLIMLIKVCVILAVILTASVIILGAYVLLVPFLCKHEWEETRYCLDHEEAHVPAFVCKKCGYFVPLYTPDGCGWNHEYFEVKNSLKHKGGHK